MSKKTSTFDNIEENKKEFQASKQPLALDLVKVNQILISDKFKPSDTGFKYFIGYKDDSIVRTLCIILPQMSGYITSFDNGGKNMSLMIEDDSVLVKYNDIWNKIKEIKGMKFHSNPVYDEKYIKAKVKKINFVVNTNFWGNEVTKEGVHQTYVAYININSAMKMNKKIIPKLFQKYVSIK